MNKSRLSSGQTACAAAFGFAVLFGLSVSQGQHNPVPCYTLVWDQDCGVDSIGDTLTCPDGTGGPNSICVAASAYKCSTVTGSGWTGCRQVEDEDEWPQGVCHIFQCIDGTYTNTEEVWSAPCLTHETWDKRCPEEEPTE